MSGSVSLTEKRERPFPSTSIYIRHDMAEGVGVGMRALFSYLRSSPGYGLERHKAEAIAGS